jgi:hypothetical protein
MSSWRGGREEGEGRGGERDIKEREGPPEYLFTDESSRVAAAES